MVMELVCKPGLTVSYVLLEPMHQDHTILSLLVMRFRRARVHFQLSPFAA